MQCTSIQCHLVGYRSQSIAKIKNIKITLLITFEMCPRYDKIMTETTSMIMRKSQNCMAIFQWKKLHSPLSFVTTYSEAGSGQENVQHHGERTAARAQSAVSCTCRQLRSVARDTQHMRTLFSLYPGCVHIGKVDLHSVYTLRD